MKRREFVNWAGLGLIASYLPLALVACAEDSSVAEDVSDSTLSIGTAAQLEENAFLSDEEAEVLVVKDSSGKLMAVNPTCTHQGCTVEWQANDAQFVCPCHNAKFSSDGKVLAKPAPEPLSTYQVREENGQILVEI